MDSVAQPDARTQAPSCDASYHGLRCVLPLAHDGEHTAPFSRGYAPSDLSWRGGKSILAPNMVTLRYIVKQ